MKILFVYSTNEGQTLKIVKRIAEQLIETTCDFVDLGKEGASVSLADYDKVLIAASIRYGKFNRKLYHFIEQHQAEFERTKAAFVCVNLTARKEAQGKDTAQGCAYIKTFLAKSQWQPECIGVFAGALLYPQYGLFDKYMIKLIMKLTGGETDTSKEVEYTNWDKVKHFANAFEKWEFSSNYKVSG